MAKLQITKAQRKILQSEANRICAIMGIAGGKSFIASEWAIQRMLKGAYVIATSPTYKMLKQVLWAEILTHLRNHGIPFEEHKADMTLDITATGGRLYGYSTENVENARGLTADCLVMDEAALSTDYDYDVLSGRLRRGKVPMQSLLISTPRGKQNWLYGFSQAPGTDLITQATMANPFLPAEYIKELKERYSDEFARQELYGDFCDLNSDYTYIQAHLCNKSCGRDLPIDDEAVRVAGLDIARSGKDKSALVIRQGNHVPFMQQWDTPNLHEFVLQVCDIVVKQDIDALVVDATPMGAGPFDELKHQIGNVCELIEFNGAFKPSDPNCKNARVDVWQMMKVWIERTGQLPSDNPLINDLVSQLSSIEYYFDNANKLSLESKVMMARRGIKSPDIADGLSMTFFGAPTKRGNQDILEAMYGSRLRG